jgi:hypothetical protein
VDSIILASWAEAMILKECHIIGGIKSKENTLFTVSSAEYW